MVTRQDVFRPQRGVWLAVAWVTLVVAALSWGIYQEQHQRESRARAALAAAGVTLQEVFFEGRDAVLAGDVSPQERSRAEAAIRQVEGVRDVRWVNGPQEQLVAEVPVPTTVVVPRSPVPLEPAVSLPPADTPYLSATMHEGTLTIEGTIHDAAAAARVAAAADLLLGPRVDNKLTVDTTLPPAPWVSGAADAISVLSSVGSVELTLAGEHAVVRGLAPTSNRRENLEYALQAVLGPAVHVESDLIVTGLRSPVYEAAGSNGTVTLRGQMPDQGILSQVLASARTLYGSQNVLAEMTVGERIDTTFSLVRLPLTLSLLAPVPHWQIRIVDNAITGTLRAESGFAYASAQIGPELESLLLAGAEILEHNPELVMTVEGHTDSVGASASNQRLSEDRAEAAVAYLIVLGVDPDRLTAVGYGESRPIASNATPEEQALNRRIELTFNPRAGGPE